MAWQRSPAAKAGIRPGNIVVKVNGVPAFIGDTVNQGFLDLRGSGGALLLPRIRHFGPAREIIDTIGVPVDHYAPMTALDLATRRDPGVAKALTLL